MHFRTIREWRLLLITKSKSAAERTVRKARERRNPTNFGKKLKDARETAGYSLQDLGATIGASASYLSKLETGAIKEPSGAVLVRLAKVFDWGLAELHICFLSEHEMEIDQYIEELERKLEKEPHAQPLILGSRQLRSDLKGKELYLAVLREIESRTTLRK